MELGEIKTIIDVASFSEGSVRPEERSLLLDSLGIVLVSQIDKRFEEYGVTTGDLFVLDKENDAELVFHRDVKGLYSLGYRKGPIKRVILTEKGNNPIYAIMNDTCKPTRYYEYNTTSHPAVVFQNFIEIMKIFDPLFVG